MTILGLNAFHGDSSACLVVDGRLLAAVEEERFTRIKHWAGFPSRSIRYCLEASGRRADQIDMIAINRNPKAHLFRKMAFVLSNRPSAEAIRLRVENAAKTSDVTRQLAETLGVEVEILRHKIRYIEHHCAHLASAFFVSPLDSADIVSVDGFGDFVSTMWAKGQGNSFNVTDRVFFPHSLGHFYLSMTQFLGFKNYGDEYKLMGLAAYSKPPVENPVSPLVRLLPSGKFELDLRYFIHHREGTSMTWNNTKPQIQDGYSETLTKLLGPSRSPDGPVDDRHKMLAASTQAVYEEAFFHLLNHVQSQTKSSTLCLAGGCAMNSVANGKIFEKTPYRKVYVSAASGDAGGAIGAAYYLWNQVFKKPRSLLMDHAYWGPEFNDQEIGDQLLVVNDQLKKENCTLEKIEDMETLCQKTAQAIADGKVIGWFQDRMEWGPRALGNRSILGDPRRSDMKDILNLKIKRRESFRPFAPSILREKVSEWFETDSDVPFMSMVFQIRSEKRSLIPAVTHVDGSGRLQTVSSSQNPLYYRLIGEFYRQTGVPLVLNTSFNENEPIVCLPQEALECFLRTKMDVLVLGRYFIRRIS